MLIPLLLGCAAGVTASATAPLWLTSSVHDPLRRTRAPVSWAATSPTLDAIMDANQDVTPIRAVIVGGGYAGAKLASQLDSVFHVTLVDEKNYVELSDDLAPILCQPWHSETHLQACRQVMALHRYYLKHANVITGTVDGVGEDCVYLQDGRSVPYDLLFVATGARRAFPFQSEQRTLAGRVEELRQFNQFLQGCRKVAVIGGGPVGTSLAYELASARRLQTHTHGETSSQITRTSRVPRVGTQASCDETKHAAVGAERKEEAAHAGARAGCVCIESDDNNTDHVSQPLLSSSSSSTPAHTEIHLFHRHAELLPGLPRVCREHARAALQQFGNEAAPLPSSSSSVSVHLHLSTHVTRVEPSNTHKDVHKSGVKSSSSSHRTCYRVHYDVLDREVVPQRSILAQAYFGLGPQRNSTSDSAEAEATPAVRNSGVEDGFDHVFAVTGSTPRPIKTANETHVYHGKDGKHDCTNTHAEYMCYPTDAKDGGVCWSGDVGVSPHRPANVRTLPTVFFSSLRTVLSWQGGVCAWRRRGVRNADDSTAADSALVKPNLLAEHTMPDGHYRVSTRLQLFARPNIFAVGRCNNIPATRCYGTSDVQVRTLFRFLNGITLNPSHDTHRTSQTGGRLAKEEAAATRGGGGEASGGALPLGRMLLPRMSVRLGAHDAVSSTPWTGGIVGPPAVHELRQDRQYLNKEFVKPVFFKQRDAMRVAERVRGWLRQAITDITDFSHCEQR